MTISRKVCPDGVKNFETLQELSYDLIWYWDHRASVIWNALDPDLWALTRNPLVLLQTVSKERLDFILTDPRYSQLISELKLADEKLHTPSQSWFEQKYPRSELTAVAYFSMEFMLSESLPIYSGGLGNVAGDQLKATHDLGVPVYGVGLLYQQGYFRQIIDKNGAQQALYPYNSPEQLPIQPVRLPNGEWLRIEIALPGWKVWLRAWEVKVGRVKLYLLDSNDAANYPPHRAITSELYGGDAELRLKQEIVLGIGGWRLLEAIGIHPEVCHLNEGHAAFAILERIKSYRKKTGVDFQTALAATRAGNLFTTHTAVPAGFDRFSPFFMEEYFGHYAREYLGISIEELLALGRAPDDSDEMFNMAYLAVNGSRFVNGVSALHETVSRKIFAPLFPRWPSSEIPISHVTNGVHVRSWDSAQSDQLWTETCGADRWARDPRDLEAKIKALPDARIWKMRNDARREMIEYGRDRLARVLKARGAPESDVARAKTQFDPNALVIGFARRFATYKRPNMLLHDPERLVRILTNKEHPVQLILAGKAHPADQAGKDLIQKWMQFISRPEVRGCIFFVTDYDVSVTQRLVGGVDLWLNTPKRPWEACGTSGMKILANGGLNLSELDGWWAEAYCPEVGWAIGDGKEHGDASHWDAREANQLYDLLEHQVIPEFYTRNDQGIPTAWVARVRESMARLTPQFSANRAVRNYTEKYYLPAAKNFRNRSANNGALAKQIADWKQVVANEFSQIEFRDIRAKTEQGQYTFEVQIFFGSLPPDSIRVELFANGLKQGQPERIAMNRMEKDEQNLYLYRADIIANRPINDYSMRVIPYHSDVCIPLESHPILWQK